MLQSLIVSIGGDITALQQAVSAGMASMSRFAQSAMQMGNTISSGFGRANTAANTYRDSQGRLREANGRFADSNTSSALSLGKLTLGYLSAAKALDLVKQGLGIISNFERLDAGLRAVSTSTADYARTQTFLRSTSDTLGLSYETLADTYKGLKAAANSANIGVTETERIFSSVVRAGAALRLSNDQVQGTLLALQQMLSKGTVSSEELRQQLGERLPGAMNLMANALGVSTEKLNKMLEQGQVMAADALPKLATELERVYGAQAQSNLNSMAGGWTRATDQLKLFLSEFSKENGISSFFAKLGNGLANYTRGLREAMSRGESLWNLSKDRRVELDRQAGMRTEFRTATPGRRNEMLDQAKYEIGTYKADLKNPNLPDDQRSKAVEVLSMAEERLMVLRRENIKVSAQEWAEAARAGAQALATHRVFFDLERDKKRLTELKTIIANKRGNGQDYSKEQGEYSALNSRIEKATATIRKPKKEKSVEVDSTLTVLERIRGHIEEQMQDIRASGAVVGEVIRRQLTTVENQIAKIKGEYKRLDYKPVLDLKQADTKMQSERIAKFSDYTKNKLLEIKRYGSLDWLTEQLNKIRTVIQSFSLKNLSIPKEVIDSYTDLLSKANRVDLASRRADTKAREDQFTPDMKTASVKIGGFEISAFRRSEQQLYDALENMKEGIRTTLEQTAQTALVGMASVIGGLIAGTVGVEALPSMLLSTFGDMLTQLGRIAIQTAIGIGAIKTALETLNPVVAAVAGIALIALGSAITASVSKVGKQGGKAAVPMAAGGYATGSTYSLTGEYDGANLHRNGEFVAPVRKGARLLVEEMMQQGGGVGGGGEKRLVAELSGSMIRIALERDARNQKTYGG